MKKPLTEDEKERVFDDINQELIALGEKQRQEERLAELNQTDAKLREKLTQRCDTCGCFNFHHTWHEREKEHRCNGVVSYKLDEARNVFVAVQCTCPQFTEPVEIQESNWWTRLSAWWRSRHLPRAALKP